MDKRIIFSGVAIVGTLAAAFLSQQAIMRVNGKTFISDFASNAKASVSKGADWVMSKAGGEIKSGGESIKSAADQTAEKTKNISDSLGKKVENYFSNLGNSIIGKTPDACQTAQPSSSQP